MYKYIYEDLFIEYFINSLKILCAVFDPVYPYSSSSLSTTLMQMLCPARYFFLNFRII